MCSGTWFTRECECECVWVAPYPQARTPCLSWTSPPLRGASASDWAWAWVAENRTSNSKRHNEAVFMIYYYIYYIRKQKQTLNFELCKKDQEVKLVFVVIVCAFAPPAPSLQKSSYNKCSVLIIICVFFLFV